MCRNIRTLFNFEPPATDDEIRASALQFVRKLSGFTHPSKANEPAFERAIDECAEVARRLLESLQTAAPTRDREVEAAKAKARAREIRNELNSSSVEWVSRRSAHLAGFVRLVRFCMQAASCRAHAFNGSAVCFALARAMAPEYEAITNVANASGSSPGARPAARSALNLSAIAFRQRSKPPGSPSGNPGPQAAARSQDCPADTRARHCAHPGLSRSGRMPAGYRRPRFAPNEPARSRFARPRLRPVRE